MKIVVWPEHGQTKRVHQFGSNMTRGWDSCMMKPNIVSMPNYFVMQIYSLRAQNIFLSLCWYEKSCKQVMLDKLVTSCKTL